MIYTWCEVGRSVELYWLDSFLIGLQDTLYSLTIWILWIAILLDKHLILAKNT